MENKVNKFQVLGWNLLSLLIAIANYHIIIAMKFDKQRMHNYTLKSIVTKNIT